MHKRFLAPVGMLMAWLCWGYANAAPPPAQNPRSPVARAIDISTLPVLQAPSLALRHYYLTGLTSSPESLRLPCRVLSSGWLSCEPAEGVPPEVAKAARSIAGGYQYDLTAITRRNDEFLLTDVTVSLIPPKLELERGDSLVAPASEVVWAKKFSMDDLARYYPDRATRWEQSARVRLTCRILADYSLTCVDGAVSDMTRPDAAEEAKMATEADFIEAARRIALRFQSEPLLKDGSPAEGKWVEVKIAFRLPQ
jgi:hypothetical protein